MIILATFESLNLNDDILHALNDLQFLDATEIQEKAIPEMIAKKDIIGIAQTGTGKTFAYSIPLIQNITEDKYTQALVLCPTRELGMQVSEEISKLIKYKKYIKIATIYGGTSYDKQIRELKAHPQIVVGTPGRIIDHMNRKTIDFSNLHTLVLDEADEMLNMGFKDDLETILASTPKDRQTALFSATMPEFIKHVAQTYLVDPTKIEIKKKTLTVDKICQDLYYLKRESKTDLLIRLLDLYNFSSVMIFVNTKSKVEDIVSVLKKNNYKAEALHGDLKQASRDKVMSNFKSGITKILVCTDVAARGIDVDTLEAIINFDLPMENELYVHRIGRTGRAGRDGLSISFASYSEARKISFIERYTRSKMNVKDIPSIEEIKAKTNERYLSLFKSHLSDELVNQKLILAIKESSDNIDQILNALINLTNNSTKDYPEIHVKEFVKYNKDDRQTKSRRLSGRDRNKKLSPKDEERLARKEKYSSPKDYKKVLLNVGRDNKFHIQEFIHFVSNNLGVRKSNIGDIKINNDNTIVEVTKGALPFMEKLNGKTLFGKTIKISKAK